MEDRREQLVERLRDAERARDLLRGLERLLKGEDSPELERTLGRLGRLAQPLSEADRIRWSIEPAVEGEPRYAGGTIDRGAA